MTAASKTNSHLRYFWKIAIPFVVVTTFLLMYVLPRLVYIGPHVNIIFSGVIKSNAMPSCSHRGGSLSARANRDARERKKNSSVDSHIGIYWNCTFQGDITRVFVHKPRQQTGRGLLTMYLYYCTVILSYTTFLHRLNSFSSVRHVGFPWKLPI